MSPLIFSLISHCLIIGPQSWSWLLNIFVFDWVVIKRQSVNVPSYHSRLWLISKPHCRELYVMWILIKATVLKLFLHFSLAETFQSFMSQSLGQERVMFAFNMYINSWAWSCITPEQQIVLWISIYIPFLMVCREKCNEMLYSLELILDQMSCIYPLC